MIQCVGARDEDRAYCSRTCCLTAVKNALLLKEADASLRVYILYRDMMAYGVREEALYRQARGRGVIFISYDPGSPPVVADGGVSVRDELLGQVLDIPTDLVVLSTPAVPHSGAVELAQMLKVPLDRHGFFLEAHVKLRPLDFATDGIFVCGSARWPCTVSDAVTQAYGAAARAAALLSKGEMEVEPIVSVVEASKCLGCGLCETLCPYQAIVVRGTNAGRKAETVAASCKGCGVCAAACPAKAISIHHYTDEQVLAQVDAFAEVAR
jgi:heterodisulfide reductase subunit A